MEPQGRALTAGSVLCLVLEAMFWGPMFIANTPALLAGLFVLAGAVLQVRVVYMVRSVKVSSIYSRALGLLVVSLALQVVALELQFEVH